MVELASRARQGKVGRHPLRPCGRACSRMTAVPFSAPFRRKSRTFAVGGFLRQALSVWVRGDGCRDFGFWGRDEPSLSCCCRAERHFFTEAGSWLFHHVPARRSCFSERTDRFAAGEKEALLPAHFTPEGRADEAHFSRRWDGLPKQSFFCPAWFRKRCFALRAAPAADFALRLLRECRLSRAEGGTFPGRTFVFRKTGGAWYGRRRQRKRRR